MIETAEKRAMGTRGVSLRPEHEAGLVEIAIDAGHLSRSRAVQEWIESVMTEKYGVDWAEVVLSRRQEAAS